MISLLLIIALIIGIALLVKRSGSLFNRKYVNGKRVQWMVVGYVVILFIALGINLFIPVENLSYSNTAWNKANEQSEQIHNAVFSGRIDDIDSSNIRGEWTFDYTGEQLYISVNDHQYYGESIIVEKVEGMKNAIEAFHISSLSLVNNIDISDKIIPIDLDLTEDVLTIIRPDQLEITMARFNKEFTITQFTEEGWFANHSNSMIGSRFLYLRIPSDLELVKRSDIHFYYINDR